MDLREYPASAGYHYVGLSLEEKRPDTIISAEQWLRVR